MAASICAQDHVVLLLSPQDFEKPPSWLSDNFSIVEGGVHAGGSSRNKLIVFADGTYLELFCWTDTPREFHAWANKSPGLIDFALTSLPPSTAQSLHDDIMSRLRKDQNGNELDVIYNSPEPGSRARWDGVQVKWESSRSKSSTSVKRTDFPFFCHDVTPRNIRVAFEDHQTTTHPCGAVGISTVRVLVSRSASDRFTELYGLILGIPPRVVDGDSNKKRFEFRVGLPTQRSDPSTISVRSEQDEKDRDWLLDRGAGICGLELLAAGREGHGVEALGTKGMASTISVKW